MMKKNIAILVPQLAGGGAERVASNLLLHLPDEKYNKFLIVFDDKKIDYPYKGKLINLDTAATTNPLGKIKNFIKRIYRLRKVKKIYNIDTTISLLSSSNIVNILSRQNDKVIVSVRNYISKSSEGFYGMLYRLLIKILYNKADLVIAVSNLVKNDLISSFRIKDDKIKVIYNPYDLEKIRKLASEEIEIEYQEIFKFPTIITVGRLTKQKGQWHLIRAFKKVKEVLPDVKLVILGQGELEDYLKKLTIKFELEKDVYFLGFQKNPFKYINRSTIYVFPSLYEGFPNALCEAMACGIPVISADCKSGPREILAPETDITRETKELEYGEYGILVPVCDGHMYDYNDSITREEQILSKSIVELLENQALLKQYSIKVLSRIKDFEQEIIIKLWEKEI